MWHSSCFQQTWDFNPRTSSAFHTVRFIWAWWSMEWIHQSYHGLFPPTMEHLRLLKVPNLKCNMFWGVGNAMVKGLARWKGKSVCHQCLFFFSPEITFHFSKLYLSLHGFTKKKSKFFLDYMHCHRVANSVHITRITLFWMPKREHFRS